MVNNIKLFPCFLMIGLILQFTVLTLGNDSISAKEALIAKGELVFNSTCFACHGLDGKGLVPGTPDLGGKKSPLVQDSQILKERIINGYQSKGSPLAMPPKGGNLGLNDQDIDAVIVYMKDAFLKKKSSKK